VATAENHPASILSSPDPTLRKYSTRQLAVANTWAEHFRYADQDRAAFVRHYLRSTSKTRCWCVVLGEPSASVRPVLARFGEQIQFFDGRTLSARLIVSKYRVPLLAPSPSAALKLVERLGLKGGGSCEPLLTSFSKRAHEIAQALSTDDLPNTAGIRPFGRHLRYFATRNRFYLTQIGAVLKRFCQHLDPELLHAIRSVRCPAASVYNWLARGDRQRRLQALRAQPVLVPLLVLSVFAPWPHEQAPWPKLYVSPQDTTHGAHGPSLLGLVADEGLPLNDVLAWLFQAPRSDIRYLGQQRPYHIGGALSHLIREGRDAGWQGLLAGASLGNRRPTQRAQWQAFFAIWEKLPWEMRGSPGIQLDLTRLFTGCPVDWRDPAWPQVSARIADLREIFNNLDRGHGHEVNLAKSLLNTFLAKSTYHQIGNLVDDFHTALNEIRTLLKEKFSEQQDTDEYTPWSSFLLSDQPIDCPNGLQIVELKCPDELSAESFALGHCIETYDFRAYSGRCRLLSVRSNGKSLASAEVVLVSRIAGEVPAQWRLQHLLTQQLRGPRNAVPGKSSPEKQAYDWFWSRVRTGRIPVTLEWPDMTRYMTRFATNDERRPQLAQAVAQWVIRRLEQA